MIFSTAESPLPILLVVDRQKPQKIRSTANLGRQPILRAATEATRRMGRWLGLYGTQLFCHTAPQGVGKLSETEDS